jgi:hypothetical protein
MTLHRAALQGQPVGRRIARSFDYVDGAIAMRVFGEEVPEYTATYRWSLKLSVRCGLPNVTRDPAGE